MQLIVRPLDDISGISKHHGKYTLNPEFSLKISQTNRTSLKSIKMAIPKIMSRVADLKGSILMYRSAKMYTFSSFYASLEITLLLQDLSVWSDPQKYMLVGCKTNNSLEAK